MRSLFGGDTYESDNDERLDKKFSYNYQVIKSMYPKASELPEEEVRGIIRKYYQAPKGQEEQVIKDYIRQKEPEWQAQYFDEDNDLAHSTNLSENILGKAKDIWNIATDTVKYTPEAIGELAADANIAYRHWKDMNRTGKKLVNKYGSNAAANIDDYYHSLLQCQLAKISPVSRKYGLALGYGKEIYDYYKKKNHMFPNELIKDMQKDLHNNIYGSNIGKKYRNKPCQELLDEFRTENMRQEKIY